MVTDRPIDVLNDAKGKRVLIKLKRGTEISGILQAMSRPDGLRADFGDGNHFIL